VKVVLFCGGLGLRLRGLAENLPKPMVSIGYRPVLWHLMKYYAHHGHTDFILCLGYKADAIKSFFLDYDEAISNDFVLSGGDNRIELLHRDIDKWRITFCDTGLTAPIGQRLRAVRRHLEGEEYFFANYTDGLTDLPLHAFADRFKASGKTGAFTLVRPTQSFHVVAMRENDQVADIRDLGVSDIRINGGFFMFRRDVFDYIRPNEELVHEPFRRMIDAGQLVAYEHTGFWTCMDTFKDQQRLEDLWGSGQAPWELWREKSPDDGATGS
jgi:glucose-1-phosphate cytidylyltransferase